MNVCLVADRISGRSHLIAITSCVGLSFFLLWRHLRRASFLRFRAVPGWPLVGVLPYISGGEKLVECAERWAEEYGDEGVFEFSIVGQRMVVCCSHTEAKKVLVRRPFKVQRTRLFLRFKSFLDGLFNAEGEQWNKQRRLVAPAFNAANTRGYFEPVRSLVDALVSKLSEAAKQERSVNFTKLLPRFTADVISKVAFGRDFGSLTSGRSKEVEAVNQFMAAAHSRVMAPFEWWRLPLLGRLEGTEAISDHLSEVMSSFIKEHEQHKTTDTLLAKMVDVEGEKLTHAELLGNMKTMFLAGTDTTSITLAWSFYYLAQQPELQEKIAIELACKAPGGISSIDELEHFDLVRAVWAETLRLRSVTPYLLFTNMEPLCLAGRQVPPGTEIMLLTRYYQDRMPELQASGLDPREYQPERWLVDGVFQQVVEPIAFGHGARVCIGRRLADLEGQVTIAEVVRNFRLSGGLDKLGESTKLTQVPDKDIVLELMPRLPMQITSPWIVVGCA